MGNAETLHDTAAGGGSVQILCLNLSLLHSWAHELVVAVFLYAKLHSTHAGSLHDSDHSPHLFGAGPVKHSLWSCAEPKITQVAMILHFCQLKVIFILPPNILI